MLLCRISHLTELELRFDQSLDIATLAEVHIQPQVNMRKFALIYTPHLKQKGIATTLCQFIACTFPALNKLTMNFYVSHNKQHHESEKQLDTQY